MTQYSPTPRVLMFVEDPGGANGLMHLTESFIKHCIMVDFFATGHACDYLSERNIDFIHCNELTIDKVAEFEAVLIGTSENKKTIGFELISMAKALKIPNFTFVDGAVNSQYRFRGETQDPLQHVSDFLFCNEEKTKQAFLELGMSEERLIVTGNPHYESLKNRVQIFSQYDRGNRRNELFGKSNSKKTIVTFLCETLSGFDMSNQHIQESWTMKGRGKSSLRLLVALETLLDVLTYDFNRSDIHFVLRLHPKNSLEEFSDYSNEIDQVSDNVDPLELVYFSDFVCGIETSLLIEACLMGNNAISIQPDETIKHSFPDFVKEKMMMPRTRAKLIDALTTKNKTPSEKFSYPYQYPSDVIVKSIKERLDITL